MTSQLVDQANFTMPDGELIHIRPLVESDLSKLEWEGEFSHFRTLYQQHYESYRSGSTLIWVAEDEYGQVVGQIFLLLYSRSSEIADGLHRAYLFSFRIRPEWRGQGLGSFMLQFAEDQLLMRGYSEVRLNVARANPLARHLYEIKGYRIIGPDPGVWRYQDEHGRWKQVFEPAWKMLKKIR
ncbi:MAG: GNAT family N-acetyltransferase [Anaerolineaceae bacterium]|jgi:GNAT superfamily N-acetyltransferase